MKGVASSQGPWIVCLFACKLWNMRGQTSCTLARHSTDRQAWEVEMQERKEMDKEPKIRLDKMEEGRTGLEIGRMRKQKTERQRREKAER